MQSIDLLRWLLLLKVRLSQKKNIPVTSDAFEANKIELTNATYSANLRPDASTIGIKGALYLAVIVPLIHLDLFAEKLSIKHAIACLAACYSPRSNQFVIFDTCLKDASLSIKLKFGKK